MTKPVQLTEKHLEALDHAVWHSCDCEPSGPFEEHHAPDCKHRLLAELQATLAASTPIGWTHPYRGKLAFVNPGDTIQAGTELTPVYHLPYAQDNPEIAGGDVKFWHYMFQDMCRTRDAGFQEAYRILGIEDDGEYRWKWLLLELDSLMQHTRHIHYSQGD